MRSLTPLIIISKRTRVRKNFLEKHTYAHREAQVSPFASSASLSIKENTGCNFEQNIQCES
jgi:hypothetical protein